ncbi:MAG: L-glutamate gamma-semialdehyde dehydrogenase [Bacteroidota bacterium]
MNNARVLVPSPVNEPVLSYAPGTPEREAQKQALAALKQETFEITPIINGKRIPTGRTETVHAPHERAHEIGTVHKAGAPEVEHAIAASMAARAEWSALPWEQRASVFLKAADLLAGPWRARMNAATMLGQSKNVHQAEIDSACELIDFFRFNVAYMAELYEQQPGSAPGIWNQLQYRPLDGFVFAVTPFNFTAIAGNLPGAPAMLGNAVLWKPSTTSILSNYFVYLLLEEAGLPPGVINFLPGDGPDVGDPTLDSEDLAGLHFTGSTGTFQHLWKTIGMNIAGYRSYPRIVGETGGKDFIVAHPSADAKAVATAIVRGGFEYQGQKCSAASRVYVPNTLWPKIKEYVLEQLAEVKMGPVDDFSNFVNAVIDQKSFDKITGYIDRAKNDVVEVVAGGTYDDSEGFFIAPTILRVDDPHYVTMREELFGPVVTLYVYDANDFDDVLPLVDSTSPYALTGSIFAQDRYAVNQALKGLQDAAGNFYINDKPTGAVVGQQPFGGGRASGTNDKAGSILNLIRWVSPRTIKETFNPPHHFGYPYLR